MIVLLCSIVSPDFFFKEIKLWYFMILFLVCCINDSTGLLGLGWDANNCCQKGKRRTTRIWKDPAFLLSICAIQVRLSNNWQDMKKQWNGGDIRISEKNSARRVVPPGLCVSFHWSKNETPKISKKPTIPLGLKYPSLKQGRNLDQRLVIYLV